MNTVYLPMQVYLPEEAYGVKLPSAVVLRLDELLRARLTEAIALLLAHQLTSLELELTADQVRWIGTVGYTSENTLAPIPGWMDEADEAVRLLGWDDVMNLDVDGESADFREDCIVFDNPDEPLEGHGTLGISRRRRPGSDSVDLDFDIMVHTTNWKVGTFMLPLAKLEEQLGAVQAHREGRVFLAGHIAAAPRILGALRDAETILRYCPEFNTNWGGQRPATTTAHALRKVRDAITVMTGTRTPGETAVTQSPPSEEAATRERTRELG